MLSGFAGIDHFDDSVVEWSDSGPKKWNGGSDKKDQKLRFHEITTDPILPRCLFWEDPQGLRHLGKLCHKSPLSSSSSFSGLDEELANAIDKAFYDRYKTWKLDNPNASTRQQVTEVGNMLLYIV